MWPICAELPTLQPNRLVHYAQNFQHFNPIDRYTSTCASNIHRTSNTSTQPIGRHTSTCVANMRRTSNTSTQPIGKQVPVHPVHPTSAELPTLQPNRSVHYAQNFQHFNPIDRYTSTCASNIRRTSNTSTQPIGTQVPVHPVHPTSAELPTLQPNR